MKTRRKTKGTEERQRLHRNMAPRPEDSPVSTPRTRSPVKGVRTGGVSCAGPDALSMLNMLAEVASVTLHTDPSVTDSNPTYKAKASSAASRKPSDYELLTLEHVAGMTDNLLVKLFAEFESNEMWKRFTYTCGMLPAACSKYFQSFGSEHKARAGMKSHLQTHLKSLMEVHKSTQSRQNYVLESVPARNRRLVQQESSGSRKRSTAVNNRGCKSVGSQRSVTQIGDNSSKMKKVSTVTPEKENEIFKKKEWVTVNKDSKKSGLPLSRTDAVHIADVKSVQETTVTTSKPKRKLESTREGRVRTKKMKTLESGTSATNDNNNNSDLKIEIKDEIERVSNPPMQQVVSHDHGYLKAPSFHKYEVKEREAAVGEVLTAEGRPKYPGQDSTQIWCEKGIVAGSVDGVYAKESTLKDHSTLLHEHMNQELCGGMMAQDCGSTGTPLPVVGCEVEFTPDQQYKIMRSADLPVVYDHNNPSPNVQTVSKVIERDEYKIRKKPKGRAKFIGQSKAEKEMALKLIAEIRSQSVMALDTLECKICHPARLFTAPSTLLSHYRSHAGIRPYECRICEAVFTRQHSLNYHMLIHTNQTRFTCEDCDRKFRHPSHFKEHRRRHTGESPYECSDCLMRFKTRNTYKRHLRTRHGKLLTTQGAIIILSQEEADRMKKTQGRKPRRPRQPLKIISPEAAAQMEEEQIWTDFEEGDREEEEEDEDDDEEEEGEEEEEEEEEGGGSHTDEPLQSGDLTDVGGCQISSNTMVRTLGVQQVTNGKTGLLIRSKKISSAKNQKRLNHIEGITNWEKTREKKLDESTYLEEGVEEEVVTEEVAMDDLRTYVFQPPPEHNSLPKVNIRSSWNTINIDLKSLEKATEPIVSADISNVSNMEGAKVDNIISQVTEEVTTQIVGSCTEFVGDQISPDEVITICAGMESLTDEVILSSVTRQQNAGSGNKHDWFTVKKPLKCYGRPGYSVLEPGGNITSEVTTVPSNTRPDSNINTSSGHGVYVVEYVQGQDGRLAKVYHGSASLVSRNNQQLSTYTTSADNFEGTSVSRDITSPVTTVAHAAIGSSFSGTSSTSVNNSAKLMIRGAAREGVRLQTVGSVANTGVTTFAPVRTISLVNGGSYSNNDRVVINKQVVNNVVVNNRIVKNGSLVSVSCGEHRGTPVTLNPSPSVVVTSVPFITDTPCVPNSQEVLPWSTHTVTQNHMSANRISSSMGEMNTGKRAVVDVSKDQFGHPLVNQEVQQLDTTNNELLLENVEIIESLDVGNRVTGMVEEEEMDQQGQQNMYMSQPQNHLEKCVEFSASNSKVKVEEVRPSETAITETTSEYVDQLFHQNVTQNVYSNSDVLPPVNCEPVKPTHAFLPSQSITQHRSTIHNISTVEAMPSPLLPTSLQI